MPKPDPQPVDLEAQLDALMAQMNAPPDAKAPTPPASGGDDAGDAMVDLAVEEALAQAEAAADDLAESLGDPGETGAPSTARGRATLGLAAQLDALMAADPDPAAEEESDDEAPAAEPFAAEGPGPVSAASESDLLARIDGDLAEQAQEQIEAVAAEEDSFADLASILGVEKEELAAVLPSADPADMVVASEDDAADPFGGASEDEFGLDALEGMFQSPEELLGGADPEEALAERDPIAEARDQVAAEVASFQDHGEVRDDDFASPEELLAEDQADDSWYEAPPRPGRPAPDVQAATPDPQDEAPEAAAAPAAVKPAADARKKLAEKARQAHTLSIRLRPHVVAAARIAMRETVRGAKFGCYLSNQPLDLLARKLGTAEKPAPPLRTYIGLAAVTLLIPAVLLLTLGVLG